MNKPLEGVRLLVVEDEMLILLMMEDMLADLGCTSIATAGTEMQAIALIEGQTFDAALLDMNLHGLNSRNVADALVAKNVPFAFCTGNSFHDVWVGLEDRLVIRKPFTEFELADKLNQLLSRQKIAGS